MGLASGQWARADARGRCDRALASIQSTIGYAAPATAAQNGDGDVQMDEGAGQQAPVSTLPAEIEEVVATTHARWVLPVQGRPRPTPR